MASLNISELTKSYGDLEVLHDIDLKIESGDFIVIVGPSGCGKSTLMRIISGLEEIGVGSIRLDDVDVTRVAAAKRGVAMVFQSYALYPHMTVAQNMAFSLKLARRSKQETTQKVQRAAEILQLQELLDRRPGQLSGGQKQRVAIGRAIVRDPKVFLFDEPLSNLDAELRVQMRAELIQLHAELGTTMIYVTHDQVEAMTLADKIVVMNDGHIQQYGAPLELYDDPDNTFVAGFIGSPKMNFLDAKVESVAKDEIVLSGISGTGKVTVPFPNFGKSINEVTLGVRTEHVARVSGRSGGVTFSTKISFVENLGDVTYIHSELPSGERLVMRGNRELTTAQTECLAELQINNVLIFDKQGRRLRPANAPVVA